MARALAAAIVVSLLAVSGAGGSSAQTPKRGGTLVYGGRRISEPPCLNVLVSTCTEGGTASMVAEMILQPAFDVGPRYTFRPRLVSGVDFTTQPPTLTYHIRPQAQWSDRIPVTARDFVFTHQARMAVRAELSESERQDESRIRSVREIDAKTVKVVLRSRWSGWRTLFANVLPWHVLRGENLTKIWADGIDNPKTRQEIGSGPFLLGSWERGRQLVLVRNPRYWGPHPAYLDRIVIRFTAAAENPVDSFRSGELDVVDDLNPDDVPALRRAGVNVLAGPSGNSQYLSFRIGGPGGDSALRRDRPGSRLIRRAIAYGIDRVALVSAVWNDVAPKLRPLQSVVFLRQSPYYRPHWRSYDYDPARARGLLEKAGCRRGPDGIYSCGGTQLSLRFVTPAGFPSRERLLTLMQAQLGRIGVEVIATYATFAVFYSTILPSGEFDAALFGWVSGPDPTGNELVYGCGGSLNYTGYCQRLVDDDFDQADRILDAGQQARVLNRADAQIARDVPVLPLFQVPEPTAVRDNVKNFAQSFNPLTTSENWWLER